MTERLTHDDREPLPLGALGEYLDGHREALLVASQDKNVLGLPQSLGLHSRLGLVRNTDAMNTALDLVDWPDDQTHVASTKIWIESDTEQGRDQSNSVDLADKMADLVREGRDVHRDKLNNFFLQSHYLPWDGVTKLEEPRYVNGPNVKPYAMRLRAVAPEFVELLVQVADMYKQGGVDMRSMALKDYDQGNTQFMEALAYCYNLQQRLMHVDDANKRMRILFGDGAGSTIGVASDELYQ